MTERETKVNMKSSRFVGAYILTKAKGSIITFANSVRDTFDGKKNPPIVQEMVDMQLTSVVSTIILTDTDSVYFNFLGIFNSANPQSKNRLFNCGYEKPLSSTTQLVSIPIILRIVSNGTSPTENV